MKKILFSLFSIMLSLFAVAQDTAIAQAEREPTGLRAEGKIYVVVVVVLIILAGLFLYLIRLDKKISKLEKGS